MNPASPYPVGLDGFFQPRRAAFWLLLLFLAAGLYTFGYILLTGLRVVPVTTVVGLAAWTIYTLPILLFLRSLDLFEQHPRPGYFLAFAWGGLGAVHLAIQANGAVFSLCAKLVSPEFCVKWGAAMAGPTDEEPLKLLGVILLVLVARNQFRTVSSVMAFGALSGLGFQVVEDLSYTLNGAYNSASPDQIGPVLQNFIVRGIICGAWSHTAYTAITAYGAGYFIVHRDEPLPKRLLVAGGALLVAWTLHFFWNSPLLGELLDHGPLLFLLYFPLKGLPVVLAALLLWRVARREEGEHLRALAAHFVAEDLITAEERTILGAPALRRESRRALRRAHGRAAARVLTRLQRTQLRLVRRYGEGASAADTTELAQRIHQLRAHLPAAPDPRARS
jgi:RsiW-degrading membrane proteinase PrsW (M82 family)